MTHPTLKQNSYIVLGKMIHDSEMTSLASGCRLRNASYATKLSLSPNCDASETFEECFALDSEYKVIKQIPIQQNYIVMVESRDDETIHSIIS